MFSNKRMNRVVTVNNDLLTKIRDAYKQIMVEKDVPAMSRQVEEVEAIMERGSFVSVDYSKIIEWRNSLGCWGRTDLEDELNFPFQYYI